MLDWLKTILGTVYTDDIDKKVSEEIGKAFVAKNDFNTLNTEAKQLKEQVKERDGQLEAVKSAAGAVDTLKQQITELQKANAEKEKAHSAELRRVKREALDDRLLMEAKAINALAVKPFLAAIDAGVDDEGYIALRKQHIEALAKGDSTKFLFRADDGAQPAFTGFKPGETGVDRLPAGAANPFDPKTYDEQAQLKLFRSSPDAARAMAKQAGIPFL